MLLALSLYLVDGEGLRRGEYEDLRPSILSSSGRGERSARSYSLGFLRIGGLVRLWNGRMGPSWREKPRRGRYEEFADMTATGDSECLVLGYAHRQQHVQRHECLVRQDEL